MKNSNGAPIIVETLNNVMTIRINRPEDQNRINREAMEALVETLDKVDTDPSVRVIVITGSDDYFCSGGRVNPSASQKEKDEYSRAIRAMQKKFTEIKVPVIAAVSGNCVAGGMDILAAADLAVVREGVKFGFPEITHGGFPVMVMVTNLPLMPKKKALAAFCFGELFSANEAERMGLVNCVVPAKDFWSTVEMYTTHLLDKPKDVLALGKTAYYGMVSLSSEERVKYATKILSEVLQKQARYEK